MFFLQKRQTVTDIKIKRSATKVLKQNSQNSAEPIKLQDRKEQTTESSHIVFDRVLQTFC